MTEGIWRYYFDIYNSKKPCKISVTLEKYVEKTTNYRVYKQYGITTVNKKDIGKLLNGKSIYMFERDDAKAFELFNEYMDGKIAEMEEEKRNYEERKAIVNKMGKFSEESDDN